MRMSTRRVGGLGSDVVATIPGHSGLARKDLSNQLLDLAAEAETGHSYFGWKRLKELQEYHIEEAGKVIGGAALESPENSLPWGACVERDPDRRPRKRRRRCANRGMAMVGVPEHIWRRPSQLPLYQCEGPQEERGAASHPKRTLPECLSGVLGAAQGRSQPGNSLTRAGGVRSPGSSPWRRRSRTCLLSPLP